MTHRFRLAVASVVAALLVTSTLATPAGADGATDAAITWLGAQQESDGGFELADFPPFETPDAIAAIAAAAQTTPTWNSTEALDAVEALDANGGGPGGTPLAWADAFLTGPTPSAGVAPQFLVLFAPPPGPSPTPLHPGGARPPVDLEDLMDQGELPDHSYGAGALNATLFALLAHDVLDRPAPEDTIAYVRSVQQANGGWGFAGDPNGTDLDVDTTALALSALTANGLPAGDATIAAGLQFLAKQHQESGAWQSFGADDPNSSSLGLLGVEATGWHTTSPCWRTSSNSSSKGTPYVDPDTWLRAQQVTAGAPGDLGRFASPNDGFGVNTFATSQAIQALLGTWLPTTSAAPPRTEGFTDVPACTWYTQAVAWMAERGITRKTTGTFGPKKGITNGQFARMVWGFMDAPGDLPDHQFTDIPANAAYNDAVDWMVAQNLVNDGSTFSPKRQVNRGRVLNVLWRLAGSPEAPDLTIPDVSDAAPFADAVYWAVDTGVASLLPNGTFRPRSKVTRAQAASMVYRLASTAPAWGDVTPPSTVEF